MRPILPCDLDQATRALLALPEPGRSAAMAAWLDAADLADRYRKRTGRSHPQHGDGSLLAVVLKQPRRAARFCDPAWCAAMATVLHGIATWRLGRNDARPPFLRDAGPLSVAGSFCVGGQKHGIRETFPGRG